MHPTERLSEMLELVADEESFIRFVEALIADRQRAVKAEKENPANPYGPDAGGWENSSIESFLEGAAAWATASGFGSKQGIDNGNVWKRFAAFLYAGKIYE
jgi:hypothetical protein